MSRNVLISGYEVFGNNTMNPSLELIHCLDGEVIDGRRICTVEVPVNRHTCFETMEKAIKAYQPELIICTGLADGRTGISIERTAVNVADFPVPDNAGYLALNETLEEGGPAAYFATIPIRNIMTAIREEGIPAYISNTAGTYCCNLLMYRTLHYISKNKLGIPAGMIHLPFLRQMAADMNMVPASMDLTHMVDAIKTAVHTALADPLDRAVICGACQ